MFHERLEKLRLKRGLSKAELCRQINMPPTTYSGYAMGVREPDLETLGRFARFFDVSVDYLINGTETGGVFQNSLDKLVEDFVSLDKGDQETIISLIERMKKL